MKKGVFCLLLRLLRKKECLHFFLSKTLFSSPSASFHLFVTKVFVPIFCVISTKLVLWIIKWKYFFLPLKSPCKKNLHSKHQLFLSDIDEILLDYIFAFGHVLKKVLSHSLKLKIWLLLQVKGVKNISQTIKWGEEKMHFLVKFPSLSLWG